MKSLVVLALAAALVTAPYQIVLRPAGAVGLKDLGVVQAEQGECQKGAVIKLLLEDGRLAVLGENSRALVAEPSPDGDGLPVVTFGTWDTQTGELTLHPQTKHKVREGDSLCRDLFPEGS
jgi:hypothetical protein